MRGSESKQDLYEVGIERLREHSEEICFRVMKGQSEGKGNFGYLEDEDFKRERRLSRFLQHLLWKMYLEIEGETDKEGYCDKMCYDCTYKRYMFKPERAPGHWNWDTSRKEGWYCQAECECK